MIAIAVKAPRPAAVSVKSDAVGYDDDDQTEALPIDDLLDAETPIHNPPAITAATDMLGGAERANAAEGRTSITGAAIHAVPTIGDRIGKYVVDRMIGSGGMGLVVAARHEALNETVAIKLLRPKAAGDKVHAERFAREARSMIKIKSEHVVRVLDAGTLDSGAPFIVMEFLVGKDLSQILREGGPIPVTRATDLMLQVCEAVASAHAVGVIHRDLKPSNFFVTTRADGMPLVKVLDFGISKAIGTDGVVDPTLTETQAVFGSPTYMSPEQIRSAKHVDHRSDVWSLGVGLYELMTGRLPFAADNVAGLLASIVADPPFYPRGFNPNVPPELEEVLLRALEKNPKDRLQSVADFAFAVWPFATQSAETHTLMERIARLGGRSLPNNAMSMTSTTGPKLPPLGPPANELGRISSPNLGGVFEPQVPPDARLSGITFGNTKMDLAAEAPRSQGNTLAAVAVGLLTAILILVGVGVYVVRDRFSTPTPPVGAGEPPPSATQEAPTPPTSAAAEATPPAPTPPASTPSPAASPEPVTSSQKPSRIKRHPPPKSPSNSGTSTTKAVDPTGERI